MFPSADLGSGSPMRSRTSPGERDILAELDQSTPTSFYWQLTLLATLGGFLFGYDTSNIGSALNFVPYGLHGLALGYLVSGASLGAAAGAIFAGPVADHFGRKTLLVIDAGIYAAGARPGTKENSAENGFTGKSRKQAKPPEPVLSEPAKVWDDFCRYLERIISVPAEFSAPAVYFLWHFP